MRPQQQQFLVNVIVRDERVAEAREAAATFTALSDLPCRIDALTTWQTLSTEIESCVPGPSEGIAFWLNPRNWAYVMVIRGRCPHEEVVESFGLRNCGGDVAQDEFIAALSHALKWSRDDVEFIEDIEAQTEDDPEHWVSPCHPEARSLEIAYVAGVLETRCSWCQKPFRRVAVARRSYE